MRRENNQNHLNEQFFENEIDTVQSARNFIKLLEENQTIFLNGEWGAGKSTFLKNVENLSSKEQKKNFVFMDLWRIDNSQSLITTAFRKLKPCYYWSTRIVVVLSLIVSILTTGVIKIPFKFDAFYKISPFFSFISVLLVLFVSISQLLKIKYFEFDIYFFNKKNVKNKVLVIDDFDRLTETKQKDAYKLLSFLNGKLPIIFVGSYDRILKDDSTEIFLSKIIDRRVELPIVLWPIEIWDSVFNFVSTTFGITLSENFQKIFIDEQRNLRDRTHFIDYMRQELITRNKLDHVQIEDQLIIIYTYLFHYRVYNSFLVNKNNISKVLKELQGSEDRFELVLSSILKENNEKYPVQFLKNPSIYFLFETPTNLTAKEIESQIQDNDSKLNQFLMSNWNSDFFNYITSNLHTLHTTHQKNLFNSALKLFNNNQNSDVINFLVSEKNEELFPLKVPDKLVNKSDEEIQKIRYSKWRPILENLNYDISQQLKFFVTFHICGLDYVNSYYKNIPNIVKSGSVKMYSSPEYILLEYISQLNQWYLFEKWDEAIWTYIRMLPDVSLINFLETLDIARKGETPNHYSLMQNSLDFDNDFGGLRDNSIVLKKIADRITKLKDDKYTFIYMSD